jgi:hypothetical protein
VLLLLLLLRCCCCRNHIVFAQVFARGNSAPLTQYFIWPRADAWEEMKISLESRPWVDDADKVSLLNRLTAVGPRFDPWFWLV